MNLRSHFKSSVLRPLWEFSARGVLWQVHAGSDLFLVGEDRNLEKKEVSFFCLNARDGSVLWRDLVLDEAWWVGVEALHRDAAIFHRYASPDMPGHRGITAVSLFSGTILWSREDVRYRSCSGGTLLATMDVPGGERLLELDVRDGRAIQSGAGAQLHPDAPENVPAMSFPRYIFADSPESGLLVSSERNTPAPVFPLQVVETPKHRAIIAHYQNPSDSEGAPDLSSVLLVLRQDDRARVYREILNDHVSAPTVQAMFVLDDLLIYSRQRSILSALPLK